MTVRSLGYGKLGATGPQGVKGDQGVAGPQGATGPVGAVGPAGPQGPKGDSGATGPQGGKGDTGAQGGQGAAGPAGPTGAQGPKGEAGSPANTLLGQVVIGQNATIAIALGIREVTAALTGAAIGERYAAFCRSYKLNGGASVNGRPSGYAIIDCVSNAAGQVTVSLQAPLLAIGSSYALTCDIVKVNAA